MFRFISPLKIPLFSDQRGAAPPTFGLPLGVGGDVGLCFWLGWSGIDFPHRKVLSSFGTDPVTLSRLRGAFFFRRRVKLGHRSDLRRLAADLAVDDGRFVGPVRAGTVEIWNPPTKEACTEGPVESLLPARGRWWGPEK